MSSPVHTVEPGAPVEDAAAVMAARAVTALPVVDGSGRLVGIVSRRDILRAMVRTDETLVREVQHRLDEYAPGRWTASVSKGSVTVSGSFTDSTERDIATVLARTVPGVADVRVEQS